MIKSVEMFTMICDHTDCTSDVLSGSDYIALHPKESLFDVARDADWREIDGKWYCEDCWTLCDDDVYRVKSCEVSE